MIYLMSIIYILCILLYFCRLKSKIYYKLLCAMFILPVIFIDLVQVLNPGVYIDTIRMYDEMHTFRILGWEGIDDYKEAPLSKLYLYIISLADVNQLLPIITCFLVYFILLYIVNKIGNVLEVNNKIKCLAILYMVLSIRYITITTNIRCPLALAMFFCILMYDLLDNKNKIFCIIGYIISILMHPLVLVLVLIRILSKFSLKYTIALIIILGSVCISYWNEIPNIMLNFSNVDIIVGLVAKQQGYTDRAETGAGEIISIYWRILLGMFDILGGILSILLIKYLNTVAYQKYKALINSIILISIIDFFLVVLTPESGGRLGYIILYTISIYIYIISKKEYFRLSKIGYENFKIIIRGLFIIWLIYFLYFNMFLLAKNFIFNYFI